MNPLLTSGAADRAAMHLLTASTGVLIALTVFFFILSLWLWARNRTEARRLEAQKEKWRTKLYDCFSGAAKPADFAGIVSRSEVHSLMDFLIKYSERLRGEELEALSKIAAPYLPAIARRYHRGDQYQKAWTTRVLGTFGWPESRPYLLKSIQHRSPHVAMTAFRCLIAHGDEQSFEMLVWSLKRFGTWNRNLLALQIASVGKGAIGPVRRGFADPAQPDFVRVILCTALREMNDAASADIAAKILDGSAGLDLSIACVRLIRSLGNWNHAAVVRRLAQSPNASLRAQAIRALGRLGSQSDLPLFREGLDHPSPWVALHSANAIKDIGMGNLLEDIARSTHPRSVLAQQVLGGY